MKNKSVSQHAFSLVPNVSKPRSVFNRSHSYKTTFDCDYLIPHYWASVLPGDSVKLRHSILIRMNSPLVKPVMDNLHLDWFYFFIPYRLVWSNFRKFMGEQDNPADTISYNIPQCTGPNVASGGIPLLSLQDYLGLPVGALSGGGGTTGITFNNLVPRSYNLVWNQFFRDENLQNSVTVDVGDGPDTFSNYSLLKRGKRHDYITSCLPWAQKGGTAVSLPLGSLAAVKTQATDIVTGAQSSMRMLNNLGNVPGVGATGMAGGADQTFYRVTAGIGAAAEGLYPSNLYADLTNATAATINSLRQAITLQQFLENDARGGTRYTEIVKHRWGVTSPDARLQRPEILALGSQDIKINPVSQTAQGGDGVGSLFAFGTGVSVGNGFNKSFTEHGTLLGLVMVRADLAYENCLDREWSYRTRYDMPNPEFFNLGEQAVLNKEVFANLPDGTASNQKDGVFGYQERYAEARYSRSLITGNLRSRNGNVANATTLNVYHFAEAITSQPTLGATFIQSAVPLDRNIAVPTQEHFILDGYFDEKWARVMPMFSVPGLRKL